jgi:hypothetical protein
MSSDDDRENSPWLGDMLDDKVELPEIRKSQRALASNESYLKEKLTPLMFDHVKKMATHFRTLLQSANRLRCYEWQEHCITQQLASRLGKTDGDRNSDPVRQLSWDVLSKMSPEHFNRFTGCHNFEVFQALLDLVEGYVVKDSENGEGSVKGSLDNINVRQ